MKNVDRVKIYRGEKEFAVGRLGSVIGATIISALIVAFFSYFLGAIFGEESSIVDFIRTMLTSIFSGGIAVEVLLAYREDRSVRVAGFLTIISENIASFIIVAVVMGVINLALGFLGGALILMFSGNEGLSGMISIIVFVITVYVSCATAFKYYLIKDKDMGIDAIFESFKMTKDVIFDIIIVTIRYMWIPFLIGFALVIMVVSMFISSMSSMSSYDDISNMFGSLGLVAIVAVVFLIVAVYFGARLIIANGILYSQVADVDLVSDQGIVGTEVEETEDVVEAEVVEVEVVETEVVEDHSEEA